MHFLHLTQSLIIAATCTNGGHLCVCVRSPPGESFCSAANWTKKQKQKTNAEHTADLQVMQMMVVMVMGSVVADFPAFQTIRQVSVCEEVRGEVCVSSCANY